MEQGQPYVREWSLAAKGLQGDSPIHLVAVGADGRERALGTVKPRNGGMSFQVVTAADENLELRTDLVGHSGVLMGQRWITPWARLPVENGAASVAVSDSVIEVRSHTGETLLADFSGGLLAARLSPAGERPQAGVGASGSPSRTLQTGSTVVALHAGDVIIGKAGPLRLVGALGRSG